MTLTSREGIRKLVGAAGTVALAALAGFVLADRQAVETGDETLALLIPSVVDTSQAGVPGRSGAGTSGEGPPPAAAPPPGPASRRSAVRAVRSPEVERAAAVGQMAAVLRADGRGFSLAQARRVAATIYDASRRHGIDPLLTLAVVETESSYRNEAVSFLGARGLMQIRPFVGQELATRLRIDWEGASTLHDPIVNVTMGVYYLSQLRARFDDLTLALTAYNIGPNAVQAILDEDGLVPAGYVRKVLGSYARLLAAAPPFDAEPGRMTARAWTSGRR